MLSQSCAQFVTAIYIIWLRSISALLGWPCFPFSARWSQSNRVSSHDSISRRVAWYGHAIWNQCWKTNKQTKKETRAHCRPTVLPVYKFSSFFFLFSFSTAPLRLNARLYLWGCAFYLIYWQHREFTSKPLVPIDRLAIRLLRNFCFSFTQRVAEPFVRYCIYAGKRCKARKKEKA